MNGWNLNFFSKSIFKHKVQFWAVKSGLTFFSFCIKFHFFGHFFQYFFTQIPIFFFTYIFFRMLVIAHRQRYPVVSPKPEVAVKIFYDIYQYLYFVFNLFNGTKRMAVFNRYCINPIEASHFTWLFRPVHFF